MNTASEFNYTSIGQDPAFSLLNTSTQKNIEYMYEAVKEFTELLMAYTPDSEYAKVINKAKSALSKVSNDPSGPYAMGTEH